jgi:type VI secretion system protein ImpE
MNAKELIMAGRLSEARAQLTEEVKAAPSDARKRTLLFQVLAFSGEWDKAERHLDMIVSLNPGAETGVQVYKNLVNAEKERKEVVAGTRTPGFLTGVPPYLDFYFVAWEKVKEKKIEEARTLYDQLNARWPVISGTIDGRSFSGLWDTDTFLSSFLEACVHERYVWFPFESLRELSISPPKTLFDLLWAPARLLTWEGLSVSCYLPVLYPDSCLHEDARIKLGRLTDWISLGGPFYRGVGQHVFQIGEEEIPILEIRDVTFKFAQSKEKS